MDSIITMSNTRNNLLDENIFLILAPNPFLVALGCFFCGVALFDLAMLECVFPPTPHRAKEFSNVFWWMSIGIGVLVSIVY